LFCKQSKQQLPLPIEFRSHTHTHTQQAQICRVEILRKIRTGG